MLRKPRKTRSGGYGPAVSLYRLITGAGVVLETFESDGDEAAARHARELARQRIANLHHPRLMQTITRAGFAVERHEDSGWSFVHAWVPVPPTEPRGFELPDAPERRRSARKSDQEDRT